MTFNAVQLQTAKLCSFGTICWSVDIDIQTLSCIAVARELHLFSVILEMLELPLSRYLPAAAFYYRVPRGCVFLRPAYFFKSNVTVLTTRPIATNDGYTRVHTSLETETRRWSWRNSIIGPMLTPGGMRVSPQYLPSTEAAIRESCI